MSTTTSERREYRVFCGCCDCLWIVTTFEGLLKLLQWIAFFLAFVIILATFDVPISAYKNYPEYDFMLFVAITSWVISSIHIVLKLTHIFERLPRFLIQPIVGVVCCLLGAVCFLTASSVVLGYGYGNTGLVASAACGYIAMFLLLIEAFVMFCRRRRAAETDEKTFETAENVPQPKKIDETAKQEPAHEFPE